jgi:hypothetical protein
MKTSFFGMRNAPFEFQLTSPLNLYHNSYMTYCKEKWFLWIKYQTWTPCWEDFPAVAKWRPPVDFTTWLQPHQKHRKLFRYVFNFLTFVLLVCLLLPLSWDCKNICNFW